MEVSKQVEQVIAGLKDWRGKIMAEIREIILKADPEVVEEIKWLGSPVWSHGGMVCLAGAFKGWVRITFAKGASLPDPDKLFNDGMKGSTWRAIKLVEGEKLNRKAFRALFLAGVAENLSKQEMSVTTRKMSRKSKS